MAFDRTDHRPVLRDDSPRPTRYTPMQGYDAGAARLAACLPLFGTALILVSAAFLHF